MLVRDCMTTMPVQARLDTPLSMLSELMRSHGLREIPLLGDDGRFLGMIAAHDAERAATQPNPDVARHGLLALAVMGMPIVAEHTSVDEAWALLARHPGVLSLPVVNDGRLEGVVTQHALLRGIAGLPRSTPILTPPPLLPDLLADPAAEPTRGAQFGS